MTPPRVYFRVDAGYRDDERFVELDYPLAELLYLRGLAWSKARNSDGDLPWPIVRKLAEGLDRYDGDDPETLATALAKVGLWEATERGYRVPSERWARWQTTAAEADEKRRQAAERKAAYRAKKASPNGTANGVPRDTKSRDHIEEKTREEKRRQEKRTTSRRPLGDIDDDDCRIASVIDRVVELDFRQREAERAEPIRQPEQWKGTARRRRIDADGPRAVELLDAGRTVDEVVAALARPDRMSPAKAARARKVTP